MRLRYKLALSIFAVGAAVVLGLSLIVYRLGQEAALAAGASEVLTIAREAARDADYLLQEKAKKAVSAAYAPVVVAALKASNAALESLPEAGRAEAIAALDQRWRAADPAETFVWFYMANPAASYLKTLKDRLAGEFGEIFLTNRFGALVAATHKTAALDHAGEPWWRGAFDQGWGRIFFDDRGVDENLDKYVLGVAAPIYEDDQLIGVIRYDLNINEALNDLLGRLEDGETILKLVRSTGLIVREKGAAPLSATVPAELVKAMALGTRGRRVIPSGLGSQVYAFSRST